MNEYKIYTCTFKDGDKQMIAQPFITTSDENAIITVKNAIRADASIRAMALQERISLHLICEIIIAGDEIDVESQGMSLLICENEYFKRYAQAVYADETRQKANEAEAEVIADPETK